MAADRGEDMVQGTGKGEAEVAQDRGGPIEEASMEQIAEFVSVLEELVAEAPCVADDEGAVTPDAEVSEDAEHEGNGSKNDGSVKKNEMRFMEHEYLGHDVVRTLSPPPRGDWGNVAQSEGGDAKPPAAKKARLLEDAEAAFVAEDEGALTQNEAEVAEVAEDQGNVAQSETPPPAKKKRLLEGFWVLPFSCIQKP